VILNSSTSDCDCQSDLFESGDIPYVIVDRVIEGSRNRYGVYLDNREGSLLAARHLLSRNNCKLMDLNGPAGDLFFKAIFACNDLMAISAMRALKLRNIRIPEDVQIIGFDDIDLARIVDPALSTVSQPAFDMGSKSADLLLQLIEGKKPRNRTFTLKPSLVLRDTTIQ
jgi:DNA-binding LacI/PurR family transcriptional regulator